MASLSEIGISISYIRDDLESLIAEAESWEAAGYKEIRSLTEILRAAKSILVVPEKIQKSMDEEDAHENAMPDEAPNRN